MVTDKTTAEEGKRLRDYELTLVINPEQSEEKLEATLETVSKFITDNGGAIASIDKWGKRRLAYPIKHFTEGNYILAKVQMDPSVGKQLEASLEISEDVLRHLLINLEG